MNIPSKIYHSCQLNFLSINLFSVDFNLGQDVKNKLGNNEELTNELALKIFNQIAIQSFILHSLTRPIVFIPLSIAVLWVGLAMPASGIILTALSIILVVAGSFMLEISFSFVRNLSDAYSRHGQLASDMISEIEEKKGAKIEFTFVE